MESEGVDTERISCGTASTANEGEALGEGEAGRSKSASVSALSEGVAVVVSSAMVTVQQIGVESPCPQPPASTLQRPGNRAKYFAFEIQVCWHHVELALGVDLKWLSAVEEGDSGSCYCDGSPNVTKAVLAGT